MALARQPDPSGLAGAVGSVSISGVVPLYTFGKISSIKRAAEGQAAVAAIDVERFKILVHHDVRRAYLGREYRRIDE